MATSHTVRQITVKALVTYSIIQSVCLVGKGRLKERCRLEQRTSFFRLRNRQKLVQIRFTCRLDSRIYGILCELYADTRSDASDNTDNESLDCDIDVSTTNSCKQLRSSIVVVPSDSETSKVEEESGELENSDDKTSDVWYKTDKTSDVWHKTDKTSDVWHKTDKTSDLWHKTDKTSDVWHKTDKTSDVWHKTDKTSDVWHKTDKTSDVWCKTDKTSDVWCKTDKKPSNEPQV